jgi:signal recognition particle subunit SRP54
MPVYPSSSDMNPVNICLEAVKEAREQQYDVVLLDTAGRLHIDEVLMQELSNIKSECAPQEILFVADAMTGQDAVNVAERFDELLDISGAVLTKMEGDARGGAALSIKHITGKPIKFIGTGEKLSDLEIFHPDRVASRILGMGDVLTLIEKAQSSIDEKEAEDLEKKLKKSQFDLEDFRTQMRRLKKLGSLEGLMKMVPGMGKMKDQLKNVKMPEKELARVEAIINSMTKQERREPKLINAGRKQRISAGSGTTVQEVNQLLKNFEQMQKMMKGMVAQQSGGTGKAKAVGGSQKKLRQQRKRAQQKNRAKKKKKK